MGTTTLGGTNGSVFGTAAPAGTAEPSTRAEPSSRVAAGVHHPRRIRADGAGWDLRGFIAADSNGRARPPP
ncbi:hypothetical protein GCM10009818_13790 [Nakamurella flavida]